MTPDPPDPSPDSPMLPPRHRPTLENITKDSLKNPEDMYKYARMRLIHSLAFEDARINDYDIERKSQVLNGLPFMTVNKLFAVSRNDIIIPYHSFFQ
jgi:hypothetical protein